MSAFANIEIELQKMSDSFSQIQEEIRQVQGEVTLVTRLPCDADEGEARLNEFVASQSIKDPGLQQLVKAIAQGDEVTRWSNPLMAQCISMVEGEGRNDPSFTKADLTPILCSIFPEAIMTSLAPMMRDHCEQGITEKDRQTRLKKLNTHQQKLEQQEESLANEAELNDFWGLVRRPDANPAIVLGMQE